jgi:hypothetical protein
MDITKISKDEFESALPVGMSAHDQIYSMILPGLTARLEEVRTSILGSAGESAVMNAEENGPLAVNFRKDVVYAAFLDIIRQLDTVLTPTGFGVVSNDNISPASQNRVDALEASLRTLELKSRGRLLRLLRSDSWGVTEQARNNIPYLYDLYYFFLESPNARTAEDWKIMVPLIADADEMLRSMISDAQMDELLSAFRCGSVSKLTQYSEVIHEIRTITEAKDNPGLVRTSVRRLFNDLEADGTTFSLYLASTQYQSRHNENYQNDKDSPAFFFGG